jgi:hypothetical protein
MKVFLYGFHMYQVMKFGHLYWFWKKQVHGTRTSMMIFLYGLHNIKFIKIGHLWGSSQNER